MIRFLSFLTALTLPLQALAAWSTPAELVQGLQASRTLPTVMNAEMHGRMGETFVSVWASGSSQIAEDPKGSMKMTIDFAQGGLFTVRVRAEARVVENTLYAIVHSIDVTGENDLARATANIVQKHWLMVELPEEIKVLLENPAALQGSSDMMALFSQYFTLDHTALGGGHAYSVGLTRDAQLMVLDMIAEMGQSGDLPKGVTPGMFRALGRTFNFQLTVETDGNDLLRSQKMHIAANSPKLFFGIESLTKTQKSPVVVQKPANALSLEEFSAKMEEWFSSIDLDSSPFAPAMLPFDAFDAGDEWGIEESDIWDPSELDTDEEDTADWDEPVTFAEVPPVDFTRDHVFGQRRAEITLIEYSDLECPFCAKLHPTMKGLVKKYGGKVNWVYRHYPLAFHANADVGAHASECVAAAKGNDAFWDFIDTVFADQRFDFEKIAQESGVVPSEFTSCMDAGRFSSRIAEDVDQGTAAGVAGTPATFVMNNVTGKVRKVSGAVPQEQLEEVIDAMMQ